MSCTELIESLKKSADGKKNLLWQEAEATAAATKSQAENALKKLREDAERQRVAAVRDKTAHAIADARSQARMLRLAAEKELAGRLYTAALSSLKSLRDLDYKAVFHSLVGELPLVSWQTVRVNPEDTALAARYFPAAEIVPDDTIIGGVEASAGEGAIRIINTLEKRLERAWSDFLPELIRAVYQEVSVEAPSAF